MASENKWILDEICSGLGLLMAAGLPGRPGQYARSREESAASVQAAAKAWALAVEKELRAWKKVLVINDEVKRLRLGFQKLLTTASEWPAPVDLIREIKGAARRDPHYLPPPRPTAEEQAAGKEALARIREMLESPKSTTVY